MIHYFFINPAAGQGKSAEGLIEEIEAAAKDTKEDCRIYVTQGVDDCRKKAAEIAAQLKDAPARFYACGGDGTLNEMINGVVGHSHISVGCVPTGTGNDMVRNFPRSGDFTDIRAQLAGTEQTIDLIRYSGIIGGGYKERYCANMFNIGFDCNVVELAGRLKKKPLISGSFAYLLAVFGVFIQKKGIALTLKEGERTLADGEVMLCSIANGSYCGGGICSSPQASVSDGVFDVNLVWDVTRREFLKLFPKYKAGTHLQLPNVERIISVKQCTSVALEPKKSRTFFLCADGEIEPAEKVNFTIAPGAVRFIVPKS